MIIGCSGGQDFARKLAQHLSETYSSLTVSHFPDGEMLVRLMNDVKGKRVVLVQRFFGDVSNQILEVMFAAHALRDLGAKKVVLVAPYMPYMRQDTRFHSGEVVSQRAFAQLCDSFFDVVVTVDPHLHRIRSLPAVFSCQSVVISSDTALSTFIKKKYRDVVILGPDLESYQWAERVASLLQVPFRVLEKKRHSSRRVTVTLNEPYNFSGKTVVLIDDIVSTGHTLLEAVTLVKKFKPQKIIAVVVHGLFVEDALHKLQKAGVTVFATNTLVTDVSRIDVSLLVAEKLKKRR